MKPLSAKSVCSKAFGVIKVQGPEVQFHQYQLEIR